MIAHRRGRRANQLVHRLSFRGNGARSTALNARSAAEHGLILAAPLALEVHVTEGSSFSEFMQQRLAAARAYVSGDAGPLGALAARQHNATFFGPRGGKVAGAKEVWEKYEQDATVFQSGGETHFEVLEEVEGADVAYWIGIQHATVRLAGHAQPVAMSLRVTELFRREGDSWKLVHRHADSLAQST